MFRVSVDIKYIDGFLAAIVMPDGYTLTVPTESEARRVCAWLSRVHRDGDFIRAAVTAARYAVKSEPRIERVAS